MKYLIGTVGLVASLSGILSVYALHVHRQTAPSAVDPPGCVYHSHECYEMLVSFPLMHPSDESEVLAQIDTELEELTMCDVNFLSERIELFGVDVVARIATLAEKDSKLTYPSLCEPLVKAIGDDRVLYKVQLYQNRYNSDAFRVAFPEYVSFTVDRDENVVRFTGGNWDAVPLGPFVVPPEGRVPR